MFTIDQSSGFGQRTLRHLAEDSVVWLTTSRTGGAPQPSPVWFLWQDGSLLVYSQPDTPKLRNIAANPRVSLNFNCTSQGGDVVVMTGTAEILGDAPPASQVADYIAKYERGIDQLGSTPERFASMYSVAVRVTPTSVRGH
ncbi:MAG: TIGR03667 family PPOX class F420-dependent oxidoreductase [Chloroflexia bacterium]|nr:TIGR03667 family PPOX class F420-dependent oxidoreductase [Chloroflexia bacterium]